MSKQEQLNESLIKFCSAGDLEMVKTLLTEGADVNYKQAMCLLAAIGSDNLNTADLLLSNGAEVYDRHLFLSERYNHTELSKVLKERMKK